MLRSPNAARHGESGAGDANDVIGSARGIFIPELEDIGGEWEVIDKSCDDWGEGYREWGWSSINRSMCGETGRKYECKG